MVDLHRLYLLLRFSIILAMVVLLATAPALLLASENLNEEGTAAYHQQDFELARKKFGAACNDETLISCASMADLLYRGLGGEQDLPEARRLSQKGCDGGVHFSCALLAHLISTGQGGKQDAEEGLQLHTKACHMGNAAACRSAAHALQGEDAGKTELKQSRALFHFACLGGDANGCESLAQLFHSGDGVTEDKAKARVYFEQGCTYGSARSCFNFAAYNDRGTGGITDLELARNAFKQSCDNKFLDACLPYARYLHHGIGGEQELTAAETLYRSVCESSVRNGCLKLAEFLDDERHDFPTNKSKSEEATSRFSKLCGDGVVAACFGGMVSRLFRLADGSVSIERFSELHFNPDLYAGVLEINAEDWSNKDDYRKLRQATTRFFSDIIKDNNFNELENVEQREIGKPLHDLYCDSVNITRKDQLTQLRRNILESNKYILELLKLQREVIDDQRAGLADRRQALQTQQVSIDQLIDSKGWNVIASLQLLESEIEVSNNKRTYSSLEEVKQDLESRQEIAEKSVAILRVREKELADSIDKLCKLTEHHWRDKDGKVITVAVIETDTRSIIVNIQIPSEGLTLGKIYRQLLDPDTLKVKQNIDFVEALLTYSNYSD